MEKTTTKLYTKLLEIQKRIVGLGKNKKGHNYEYVTGDKVLEHLKPLMNEYGIILKQEIVSIENTRQDYATKYEQKSEILSKVMMRFTWIDCETGEKDENLFGANGQNAWDKGVGSALTYGERYFLLKYFHIATDEDDIDNPDRKPLEAPQQAQPVKTTEAKAPQEKAPQAAANESATVKQQELILKFNNSSVFSQEEKEKIIAALPKMSKEKAKSCIDYLQNEINKRKEVSHAS